MEKFNQWRDKTTGVHPFVDNKPPKSNGSAWDTTLAPILKSYLIGPIFAVMRLVLIIVLSLWMLLNETVATVLVESRPLPHLDSFDMRLSFALRSPAPGILFHSFGMDLSEARPRPIDGLPAWPRGRHIIHGDIVLSNHSSYVDVLYLYFRFNPVFTEIVDTTSGAAKVRRLSFWEAIFRCGGPDRAGLEVPASEKMTLAQLCELAKKNRLGPVVVFPEVTTSNGKGVLKMEPGILDGTNTTRMHIITIRYPYDHFSPAFTSGSKLVHLFKLSCQVYNEMDVKYLLPHENPLMNPELETDVEELQNISTVEKVGFVWSRLLRIPVTGLGFREKREFMSFQKNKQA